MSSMNLRLKETSMAMLMVGSSPATAGCVGFGSFAEAVNRGEHAALAMSRIRRRDIYVAVVVAGFVAWESIYCRGRGRESGGAS